MSEISRAQALIQAGINYAANTSDNSKGLFQQALADFHSQIEDDQRRIIEGGKTLAASDLRLYMQDKLADAKGSFTQAANQPDSSLEVFDELMYESMDDKTQATDLGDARLQFRIEMIGVVKNIIEELQNEQKIQLAKNNLVQNLSDTDSKNALLEIFNNPFLFPQTKLEVYSELTKSENKHVLQNLVNLLKQIKEAAVEEKELQHIFKILNREMSIDEDSITVKIDKMRAEFEAHQKCKSLIGSIDAGLDSNKHLLHILNDKKGSAISRLSAYQSEIKSQKKVKVKIAECESVIGSSKTIPWHKEIASELLAVLKNDINPAMTQIAQYNQLKDNQLQNQIELLNKFLDCIDILVLSPETKHVLEKKADVYLKGLASDLPFHEKMNKYKVPESIIKVIENVETHLSQAYAFNQKIVDLLITECENSLESLNEANQKGYVQERKVINDLLVVLKSPNTTPLAKLRAFDQKWKQNESKLLGSKILNSFVNAVNRLFGLHIEYKKAGKGIDSRLHNNIVGQNYNQNKNIEMLPLEKKRTESLSKSKGTVLFSRLLFGPNQRRALEAASKVSGEVKDKVESPRSSLPSCGT